MSAGARVAGVIAEFRVNGRPRTKGSLGVYCLKNRTHTVRVEEEVAESKAWRAQVARVSREYQLATYGRFLMHEGPVEVRLLFLFPRTESVAVTAEPGDLIPSHMRAWPIAVTLGDIDKLTRNVLDALQAPQRRGDNSDAKWTSALIKDDAQVVRTVVTKRWAAGDEKPGAEVVVVTA